MNTSTEARWGWRGTFAAIAVAAVIGALGGTAIYAAAEGNNSHTFGAPHQAFGRDDGSGGQHAPMGGPGPAQMGATSLHGEFVVPDGAGGYRTELTQTGTITAISPTTITVRSADDYSSTYVIPNAATNTKPPFAVDDQVVVRATRDGQTATVTNIGNSSPGGPGGPPPHRN